jgi:uncharacterized protein (TIRG00374 family)
VKRLKHPASILLGVIISLITLWIAVRNIKWAETTNAIQSLDLPQLLLAIGILLSGLFLRAERWRIIISRPISKGSVYRATMLGYLFNYIYPARAGDVIKIVSLQSTSGISIAWLGVSGVVDRLTDILVLLSTATVLIKALPSANLGANYFFMACAGLVLLMMAGFSPLGEKALLDIDRRFVYGRKETRWRALLKRALDGLVFFRQGMVHGRRLANLGFAIVLVALSDYLSIYFLLMAFGWQLPLLAPMVIWVFISAGSALPSAPAGIGIHQLACVMALQIYGVSPSDAFALSLVLQAGNFAAILLAMLCVLGYPVKKTNAPNRTD